MENVLEKNFSNQNKGTEKENPAIELLDKIKNEESISGRLWLIEEVKNKLPEDAYKELKGLIDRMEQVQAEEDIPAKEIDIDAEWERYKEEKLDEVKPLPDELEDTEENREAIEKQKEAYKRRIKRFEDIERDREKVKKIVLVQKMREARAELAGAEFYYGKAEVQKRRESLEDCFPQRRRNTRMSTPSI